MGNIIFVTGIHGVGKTTYCKKLSEKLKLPHFSASDIIRSQLSTTITSNSKNVKNAEKNQDILLQGIEALNLKNKEIILDGHFVLMQNKKVQRLPLSTYQELGIKEIILLKDTPEKIYKRQLSRDKKSEFTISFMDEMQKEEINYAEEVSKLLDIELKIVSVVEIDTTK